MTLSASARQLLEGPALAHLVTINPDGSPQVAIVWVALDGDEIVAAHLDPNQQKLRNIRRDPRVALSIEGADVNPIGLRPTWWSVAVPASPRAAPPSCCSGSPTSTSARTSSSLLATTSRLASSATSPSSM